MIPARQFWVRAGHMTSKDRTLISPASSSSLGSLFRAQWYLDWVWFLSVCPNTSKYIRRKHFQMESRWTVLPGGYAMPPLSLSRTKTLERELPLALWWGKAMPYVGCHKPMISPLGSGEQMVGTQQGTDKYLSLACTNFLKTCQYWPSLEISVKALL